MYVNHFHKTEINLKFDLVTFLVVQWLRIRLIIQGTQVRSLVWEDSTRLGATKPMHHDC